MSHPIGKKSSWTLQVAVVTVVATAVQNISEEEGICCTDRWKISVLVCGASVVDHWWGQPRSKAIRDDSSGDVIR